MSLTETAARALALLDLTSLNDTDTDATIRALCDKAVTPAGPVAAICIYGPFVSLANGLLDQRIGLATVVNFPEGTQERKTIEADIKAALVAGADEIDLVFPWQAFLSGKRTFARDIVAAARAVCPTLEGHSGNRRACQPHRHPRGFGSRNPVGRRFPQNLHRQNPRGGNAGSRAHYAVGDP
jgi:hypothetical protein